MRTRLPRMAALAMCASLAAACGSILGLDDFEDQATTAAPGTGGTGGAGGAGTGAAIAAGSGGGATSGSGGSGAAAGTGGQAGTGGGCASPNECPTPAGECKIATCAQGKCGEGTAADGTPAATQTAGDCKEMQCQSGVPTPADDPTDVLDDGKECTDDTCSGGSPANTNKPDGEACTEGGGNVCKAGACVECIDASDCEPTEACQGDVCVAVPCLDQQQNGNETDVDCGGGACGACEPGFACLVATDCTSSVCSGEPLVCQDPTCTDTVKNGDETDSDCGGSCPGKCGPDEGCAIDADCAGGDCSGTLCLPTCTDGVTNGGEADEDCGGSCPDKCADGSACTDPADCLSGVCTGNACVPSLCTDGIKNGTETDEDCGGSCPGKCAGGRGCSLGSDCQTGQCCNLVCASPCTAGWGDCDGDLCANGCEADLATSAANCGTCGVACTNAHGTTGCAAGLCQPTCAPGFESCDGDPNDGCEADLAASAADCGACGLACTNANGTTACNGGTCAPVCAGSWASCDGNPDNGCEASLGTLSDCGACGAACDMAHASETCVSGSCTLGTCEPGWANCDGNLINGCETDKNTSVTSCGGCNNACTNPNGTTACSSGVCAPTCSAGYASCDGNVANGCETSTQTSASHCGGCGTVCGGANGTPYCDAGVCEIACNVGYGNCDASAGNGCEQPLTTFAHCSGCGQSCALANASETCASGTCLLTSCNAGYGNCDGAVGNGCETSTQTSAANCGACGASCSAVNGTPSCVLGACSIVCGAGFGNCDGSAANGCETPLGSVTNCGACGSACSNANGTTTCSGNVCVPTCSAGYGNCDGQGANGCETNLGTSSANCGACGSACANPNGTTSCSGGVCAPVCTGGFGNCDGNAANGCETDTTISATHCGACGMACSNAHGATTCSAGVCVPTCSAGWGDCDGNPKNGCETSTSGDVNNCGGCGTVCPSPGCTATCTAGTCGCTVCGAGLGNCDGQAANGCETSLDTLANCGACGSACDLANATESCTTGSCALSFCDFGFGNCDGQAANGCETKLDSLASCGACGSACDLANASESCSTGSCALVACAAGFANCDFNAANGCEVSTTTTTNCGSCGTACSNPNGTTACTAGACVPTCNAGFASCDGNAANGCETLLTTLSNCGGCGLTCDLANASESCATTTCSLTSCNAGFGNCDAQTANGCETALSTTSNCGGCGVSCTNANGTTACAAGVCVPTCSAGFASCDGIGANGCETSTTTLTNCGGCGIACDRANAAESCATGVCTLGACNAGYANCDGNANNGCEAALSSTSNCGACGVACANPNGTTTCAGGVCVPSCAAGFASCDANASNGCETSLSTLTDCGACGVTCYLAKATESCSSGTCTLVACESGFGNCDGAASNGCEVQITTTTNCGGCGIACTNANGTTACNAAGVCVPTCAAGWGDCDGNVKNGCETSLATAGNCGACGASCTAPATCQAGGCAACNDGAKNGYESDVDCGGGCPGCADGETCNMASDCQSGLCAGGTCACTPKTCAELGVECGTHLDGCGGAITCGMCSMPLTCVSGACVTVPTSCQAGATGAGTDCGPSSSSDCCASPVVTGGTFKRSYDGVSAGYTDPQYVATVSNFRLDTYEITVGRFRKFVEAGKGTQASPPAPGDGAHPLIAGSGWQAAWNASLGASSTALTSALKCDAANQTWTDTAGTNEKRPQNCLTWYEAFAFCAWDGGRLPTEAEWNYAAAGGNEQRVYPWSTPPSSTLIDCTYASYLDGMTATYCSQGPSAVGSKSVKGDGKWGHADLASNLWEWNLDYSSCCDAPWPGYPASTIPCNNCASFVPGTAAGRAIRGGGWGNYTNEMIASFRGFGWEGGRFHDIGARCARGLPSSCSNTVKDGAETDVDCGGPECVDCANGKACTAASECASGQCVGGKCGAPSCQSGATGAGNDCGLSGAEDCCSSPLVSGGTFPMGRSAAGTDAFASGDSDEQPEHSVTVSSFKLDRFEVTVGRFRRFVNSGTSTQANPPAVGAGKDPNVAADTGWQSGWNTALAASVSALKSALLCNASYQTWTEPAGANEKRPINCVTWFEAQAFCGWDGGWLPTEAEWEYAAAGGSDNRYYPWSSPASSTSIDCTFANLNPGSLCSATGTNNVGSESPKGDGKYGQSDLGGNVWEWNLDWHLSAWYGGGGSACTNCANVTAASSRVFRGGSFYDSYDLRAAERDGAAPWVRYDNVGFRCARSP